MERPRLRWAAEQLQTHTKRNSISILTSAHSSALFFFNLLFPPPASSAVVHDRVVPASLRVNKASVQHTDKRMFDPIPSRQH